MKEDNKKRLVDDLKLFIENKQYYESKQANAVNCNNMFDMGKLYENESQLINSVFSTTNQNTTEQGNSLENLMKALFGRIKFLNQVAVTNRDTVIGQIDLQITPIDQTAYDILGLIERPQGIIGECKNYKSNKSNTVEKEEIEKMCWRCCKSGNLGFFIGPKFTSGALQEINEFNLYKESICKKHVGILIVPLNLEIIKFIVENKINFCYFITWSIFKSRDNSITSYFK